MSQSIDTSAPSLAGPGSRSTERKTSRPPTSPRPEDDRHVRTIDQKYPGLGSGLPEGVNARKMRVAAALGGYKPGYSSATTSEVDESTDSTDAGSDSNEEIEVASAPSPFLLRSRQSHRRPCNSPAALAGDDCYVSVREAAGSPIMTPRAPRIPFMPSPVQSDDDNNYPSSFHDSFPAPKNVGLGLDITNVGQMQQSTITYPRNVAVSVANSFVFSPSFNASETQPEMISHMGVGLGFTLDGAPLCPATWTPPYVFQSGLGLGRMLGDGPLINESGNKVERGRGFEAFQSSVLAGEEAEEEAHYHLPSNLLSPEITMSTTEFTNSVRRWMERRQEARRAAGTPVNSKL